MKTPENEEEPVVFIIDDDESLRNALERLFRMVGLRAKTFGTTSEFLRSNLQDAPSCLVLDVRLPGTSGLDFQAELTKADIKIPIIFMTGYGDIPMTVKAMKAGALEFLPKPFNDQDMLDSVHIALQRDRTRRHEERANLQLRKNIERLSPREREVMAFVTAGFLNKQIAAELGLAEITVKRHRGSLMRKMHVRSLAELARIAELLGISRPRS
jgi:FixJ family two-component response regulator